MIKAKKGKDRLEVRTAELSAEIDRFKGRQSGHGLRVAIITERLAARFHLTDSERSALRFAAGIHDIGELVMRRDYKKSAQELTATEVADLHRHPVIAEQELHRLRFDRMTQLVVRWHHENWDGSGYPDALRENEIPLACRILRVADAFVSMREKRSGRELKTEGEALDEIKRSAGLEFDPAVVAELLTLEMFATPSEPPVSVEDSQPLFESGKTDEHPAEPEVLS